jgi:polyisoprenoid-binding protein YceI
MRKLIIVLLIAFISAVLSAQEYDVNTETSTVAWVGKKINKQHNGTVGLKEGYFSLVDGKFASGEFIIDMDVMTDESHPDPNQPGRLIGHLKSDDFFSVEKFPYAKLLIKESTQFEKGKAKVVADLTIKGKTHPIEFEVERLGAKFTSNMKFDRSLYDVRYGSGKFFEDLGDRAIDDMVQIDVTIIADRKKLASEQ